MRKLIALITLGILVLSLASCGGEENPDPNKFPVGDDVFTNDDGGIELPPVDVFPTN